MLRWKSQFTYKYINYCLYFSWIYDRIIHCGINIRKPVSWGRQPPFLPVQVAAVPAEALAAAGGTNERWHHQEGGIGTDHLGASLSTSSWVQWHQPSGLEDAVALADNQLACWATSWVCPIIFMEEGPCRSKQEHTHHLAHTQAPYPYLPYRFPFHRHQSQSLLVQNNFCWFELRIQHHPAPPHNSGTPSSQCPPTPHTLGSQLSQ